MVSSPLEHVLLEGDQSARQKSSYGRTVVAIGAFISVAGLVGLHAGAGYGTHGDSEAQLQSMSMNTTEFALAAYTSECYGFTGGTCTLEGCKAERMATCQDGKCICGDGCTGSDGVCRSKHYTDIAKKVTFANKYWHSHWLYVQSVSLMSQLSVSAAPANTFGGTQEFDVYELPGLVKGKKQYFLASNKYPNWVAAIRSTGSVLTLSASLWGLYAVNLDHSIAPYNPQGIVVHICSVNQGGKMDDDGAVMIGSSGTWNMPIWAYVHSASSLVWGWQLTSDPGSGGYWIPSSPIPDLQEC